MTNKERAITFLKLAGSGNVREAYDRFVSPRFLHHNPYFAGDRDSLLRAMEEAHAASPNGSVDVLSVIEEDDRVMTHSRVRRADPAAAEIAVVHILRFENDQIVELWDVGQEIPADSPNKNGAF